MLRDGPVVVESPPNTLGMVNDHFFRYVADMGNAGPDRGQGGKFIYLPPQWEGEIPDGITLPKGIPAKDFWSFCVYDPQTRSMLQTPRTVFPTLSSTTDAPEFEHDGSVTVWFGPEAPEGKENNWIQTLPSKGWFLILRLYGPLEFWFDKTWQPGGTEWVR